MDTKFILIVSNKRDVTTDLVVKRLSQLNIPFRRFNTEEFPQKVNCTLNLTNSETDILISNNDWEMTYNDIASIWYRRPKISDFTNTNLTQDEFNFALRESNSFLLNLWAILRDKTWINNPFDLYIVERKAYQLKVAVAAGFTIPNTIVTNDYTVLLKFIENHAGSIVAKPISHGGFGDNNEFAIYTNDLGSTEYSLNEESVNCSPFIVQEKITDKIDVRVTIFGSKVFAHKILVKNQSLVIDWRVLQPDQLSYELIEVPCALQKSITQFMQLTNLKYGAMDFVIDKNNNWFFIEINPNGQFAWLEIANGDKLIDSLIDLLWTNKNELRNL
ncbi:MAG: hypothetical protein IPM56_06445 [Ignavibacteriales bacterium]|nr:MAG: hypothetical protein IPM56_06445 [Ignavibacteriales bacterium]